jgi:hypothetical protein
MSTGNASLKWSNELVLEFLELYKAEPTIYNSKHPVHKNKMKVNDACMRIKRALSVDTSVSEMKKKKDSLMASFRHHLRRKKASITSGASSSSTILCFAYVFGLFRDET